MIASLLVTPVLALAQGEQGSISIGGVVMGEPPASAPVIMSPATNQTLANKRIDVSGTCLEGLVVKIFRNQIFAGSALCQADKTFALQIDLVENRNDLTARQYDLLSQPSPESETVQVFYTASQPVLVDKTAPQTARFQLVIDYDYNFQGIFKNEPFNLPIHFIGGAPPYAISVDWGDSEVSVNSRQDAGQFHASHTYKVAGPKTIQIRVSDNEGQEAFLQFVLIVNGEPVSALPVSTAIGHEDALPAIVFSSAVTGGASFTAGILVSSFWQTIRARLIKK